MAECNGVARSLLMNPSLHEISEAGLAFPKRRALVPLLPSFQSLGSFIKESKLGAVEADYSSDTISRLEDLPGGVLVQIISLVADVRSRNALALSSQTLRICERQTRYHLALRGNLGDLLCLPSCFTAVTDLDLSHCTPWGYSVLHAGHALAVQRALFCAFPKVRRLKTYVRDPLDMEVLSSTWPSLVEVILVRWHEKVTGSINNLELGAELVPLFLHCPQLRALDLSCFLCWTDDIVPALQAHPAAAARLVRLNLLKAIPDGFSGGQLTAIAAACPSLEDLRIMCEFDSRLIDGVNDAALKSLGASCPNLRVLHLVDKWDQHGSSSEPLPEVDLAGTPALSPDGLRSLLSQLPLLEELTLLLGNALPSAVSALSAIASLCPRISALRLGRVQQLCELPEGPPVGIALCGGLHELELKHCPTLDDDGLKAIAVGCTRLQKVTLWDCPMISPCGLAAAVVPLKSTLVNVAIVQCHLISTLAALAALIPLRPILEVLHLDFEFGPLGGSTTGNEQLAPPRRPVDSAAGFCNLGQGLVAPVHQISAEHMLSAGECSIQCPGRAGLGEEHSVLTLQSQHKQFLGGTWNKLHKLILCAPLGTLLWHLPSVGLSNCPQLRQVSIYVDGDCRDVVGPPGPSFGLSCLMRFPRLEHLDLNLSNVVGFGMSCPPGFKDVAVWERFYLHGVNSLRTCQILGYWPPLDRDLTRRSLSQVALGFLSLCACRQLFLHGTPNEHLLRLLLRCVSLRNIHILNDFPTAQADSQAEGGALVASFKRLQERHYIRSYPD